MVLPGRHKHRAEQRGPFCGPEGAERQGEGGRLVWSTAIMLGVIYQSSQTKVRHVSPAPGSRTTAVGVRLIKTPHLEMMCSSKCIC